MIWFFWFIMAMVVGFVAESKGKSGVGWFFYGLLLWPIALVHILVTDKSQEFIERKAIAAGGKKCPRCAEIVKLDARVCRFCQQEFSDEDLAASKAAAEAKAAQIY